MQELLDQYNEIERNATIPEPECYSQLSLQQVTKIHRGNAFKDLLKDMQGFYED